MLDRHDAWCAMRGAWCMVHAVYAGVPVQHAAAVDDPRVQVAGQQEVELLQKQRDGQADSEEAERAAIE